MSSSPEVVNWNRPPEWDRFEKLAKEIFPSRTSATGNLLESSWYQFKLNHEVEEIVARLLEGTQAEADPGEGKKILEREQGQAGPQTAVRLSPSVVDEMRAFAKECNVAYYEVLRAVVCYRLAGGTLGWVTKQLEKLETRLDLDTDDRSAKEVRRDKIIAALGEITGNGEEIKSFTLEEFDQAVDNGPKVPGSSGPNARETYLPLVLDRLEFTWHPHNDDLFVSTDEIEIPDVRDPRAKPKAMMSEADTRLAAKVDALEKLASLSDSRERYQYTKDEAVGINGIGYNNAGKYMRQVADSPGFSYNEDEDVLRVNKRDVLKTEIANDDALEIVGNLAIESEDETKSKADREDETQEESEQEWIDQALEELEDLPEKALTEIVITNKIARAKYPDEIDEDKDQISQEATDQVTDEEIETVQKELGLIDDEEDVDEITVDADSQFEKLDQAEVMADGGMPEDS